MKRSERCPIRLSPMTCVFLIILVCLSACSGTVPQRFEEKSAAVVGGRHSVETVPPLEGTHRGFEITEAHRLGAAVQADFQKALQLIEAEDFENAQILLEPIVATNPPVTAPYINLAKVYQQTRSPEKAEEVIKQALTLIPGHPLASHEYGLMLRKAGRFSDAKTIYESALAAYPDYLPIRKNLGILCDIYLNDLECALEQFQYYHEAQPEDEKIKPWLSEITRR